ncbi:uroporphyrinogen-III synthase [Bacillus shivajii]|uniref:uroporphyrinogen-III synthase n=1 Tax=Bacillus shivajii TaxID=1983719 RepID=UPI001CFA9DC5|nr:uroporphyrinogen-III synthase [Bacillus shivajii]UCZ52127.1 uroporphyrinogen-III synthase [Bacillus shivajii]
MTSLQGLTVVNTRAAHQANALTKAIERFGGHALEIPLIKIDPTLNTEHVNKAFRYFAQYDWIIFTSVNSIRYTMKALEEQSVDKHLLQNKKIAVVGKKTEQFLKKEGLDATVVPHTYDAEHLAEALIKEVNEGEKLLFPRGNLARNVIVYELQQANVDVDELIIYETSINEAVQDQLNQFLKSGLADIVIFTSPSTVRAFFSLVDNEIKSQLVNKLIFAVIGTVTANELKKHGIQKMIVPETYTIEGLIDTIIENDIKSN